MTSEVATSTLKEPSATNPGLLISLHAFAFALLYVGLGTAVFGGHSLALFGSQKWIGCVVIECGAVLCSWTLVYFRSWRFRATLRIGHELTTGGPFRYLRHPIYVGLDLLALGSALWLPTPMVWGAFILVAAGGYLRARAEEALLLRVFGAEYVSYCKRTWRFIPLLY
ncbi:MAG TPA: isoprenylcysteine carboxylmethyltransferase family protein [Steroidobacteraceae bacterium]|jgi:protein-S-isoprenylcysteine O-methyltransferase Ste14